ncbi:MAG: AraC family transcriptional regulator, partial [Spirochaetota bacterium]
NRERPVTDVGFDVGFTDMAAFSRAFARLHGLSPTAYRAERSNLGTANRKQGTEPCRSIAYPSDQQESTRRNTMEVSGTKPVAASSVTVAERSETTVAYVRHTGPYMGDEALFARLFRELHAWAEPRGLVQRGETEEIVIYHDDPDTVPEEKLRVSCGISVPPETEVGGTVGKLTLDAGTYAIARFEVDATEFGGAWVWLYGEWLPGSGYQPDDRLCFERYPDEEPARQADEETRVFVVDICIPVKPL